MDNNIQELIEQIKEKEKIIALIKYQLNLEEADLNNLKMKYEVLIIEKQGGYDFYD
jgi:hypothetical protein